MRPINLTLPEASDGGLPATQHSPLEDLNIDLHRLSLEDEPSATSNFNPCSSALAQFIQGQFNKYSAKFSQLLQTQRRGPDDQHLIQLHYLLDILKHVYNKHCKVPLEAEVERSLMEEVEQRISEYNELTGNCIDQGQQGPSQEAGPGNMFVSQEPGPATGSIEVSSGSHIWRGDGY